MEAGVRTSSDGLPPRQDGPQVLRRLLDALPAPPQEPLHARVVAVLRLPAAMANKQRNKLRKKRTRTEMAVYVCVRARAKQS